jgi:hypothetical protein
MPEDLFDSSQSSVYPICSGCHRVIKGKKVDYVNGKPYGSLCAARMRGENANRTTKSRLTKAGSGEFSEVIGE